MKRRNFWNWKVPFWTPNPKWRKTKLKRYSDRLPFNWSFLHFWRKPEWKEIREHLKKKHSQGILIAPSHLPSHILKPLELTSFDNAKILIIGNAPYATQGQADDIPFSSLPNRRQIPSALQTLFRSYRLDTGYPYPRTGDLRSWCRNGVLIWNTIPAIDLNIKRRNAYRTQYWINGKRLWQKLTEEIISVLRDRKDKFVFIFMGRLAQEHAYLVRKSKHLVLEVPHPSMGAKIFSKKNFEEFHIFNQSCEYLEIDKRIWRLP